MGLDRFYKLAKENDVTPVEEKDDLIINASRVMTLSETVQNVHNEQNVRYEVRNINGVHVADVYFGEKHKGTFYLGNAKNKLGTQSILSYIMFNAGFSEEPENVLSYKWRAQPGVNVELIGTLFTDRIRQLLGPENYKPSYMKYPCILAIIVFNKKQPLMRELKFSTVEEMQNIAQALRCFSFADLPAFLEYIKSKDDEPFEKFYERTWVENSGASEQITHARDYYHASMFLNKVEAPIDTIDKNKEGDTTE